MDTSFWVFLSVRDRGVETLLRVI
ncbi:hypothetical protein MASSI9I_60375 [Massilia sp. 9I]|nr:hypothetical protein MASSI9I_60375 [Massilia sp. 9I]